MELTPGAMVERYRVEGVLGQGGMATVYRVRHTTLDTVHALKILELGAPSLRRRLLQEGRTQARIAHANIVAVSDVIEVGGALGLLMELVRGPSLDRVLFEGPVPWDVACKLVPGILAGVAAAHAHGVVHRDLKPANILLHRRKGLVVPKVGDFGLVKTEEDAGQTRTGMTMGTPAYMSPEQIRSTKDVDQRTDVFALGAVLYELLTGSRAFDGDSTHAIHQRILDEGWPRDRFWEVLPPRAREAITGALRADRELRFQTVAALWAAWDPEGGDLDEAAARPVPVSGVLEAAFERWEATTQAAALPVSADSGGGGTWTASPAQLPDRAQTPPAVAVEAPSPPLATAQPNVLRTAGLVGLGAGLVGLGVLGVWAATAGLRGPIVVAPLEVPAPPPAVPLLPRTEPPPPPVAPVVAVPAPTPVPRTAPVAPPPPAAPAPAPTAPAPATGRVSVVGSESVLLVARPGGAVSTPGEVQAGEYLVRASFDGQWEPQGYVTVAAGGEVVITCITKLRRCSH